MKRTVRNLLGSLLVAASAAALPAHSEPMTASDVQVLRNAVTGGGGESTGGSFKLLAAVGEAAFSTFSGTGFRAFAGYPHQAAQPGSVASFSGFTKTTDTLRVRWNAPGVDGSTGAVAAGFWRLDFSSDTAHTFAPTTFATEIATTVAPGDPQEIELTGLLPNTTYYGRVYLGDARKHFAETSAPVEESTLAEIPLNAAFSAVHVTSAVVTWTLPASAVAGFGVVDSTAAGFAGTLSTASVGAVQVTLTVENLFPGGTYFFRVGSFNWQRDFNFETVLSTVMLPNVVDPVAALALSTDPVKQTVTLTWTDPANPLYEKTMVVLSTSSVPPVPAQGAAYADGHDFAPGAVQGQTASAAWTQSGIARDVQYTYHLFARDQNDFYSIAVSTSFVLSLPPIEVAAVDVQKSTQSGQVQVAWADVGNNFDGSAFQASTPTFDLAGFEVHRATGIVRPTWVKVTTLPATASDFTDVVPDPLQNYFYKVESRDEFAASRTAMAVDTDNNLFALAPDSVTRLKIPSSLVSELRSKAGHSNLVFRVAEHAEDVKDKVLASVSFEVRDGQTAKPVDFFSLSKPEAVLVMAFDPKKVASGGASASAAPSKVNLRPEDVGVYWKNDIEYVKMYGDVDLGANTVSVNSAFPGRYQVRKLFRADDFTFDASGMTNKAVTPNGDGLNDTVVFSFDNPKDSAVSGKIYDRFGAFVAEMTACNGTGCPADGLVWDGKSGGVPVPGGVYVYQIKSEEKVFSGTVVVVR